MTADAINLEGASHVVIEGFAIDYASGTATRAGIRSVANAGIIIRNNRVDRPGRWGIFTGFSEGVLIEGNEASRAAAEHGVYVSNSADNPVIRNNRLWGNSANGVHMNGDASEGGDGVISGALVEGNIIYDNGRGGGSGINAVSADSLAGLVSDYNAVMDRFSADAASTRLTLAQWRAATGQDAHSFVTSAQQLFVNGVADPFLANYRLSPTSVAINRGTATLAGKPAPEFDFEGTPKPQGTGFDGGADERAVTPPTTPSGPKLRPVRRTR